MAVNTVENKAEVTDTLPPPSTIQVGKTEADEKLEFLEKIIALDVSESYPLSSDRRRFVLGNYKFLESTLPLIMSFNKEVGGRDLALGFLQRNIQFPDQIRGLQSLFIDYHHLTETYDKAFKRGAKVEDAVIPGTRVLFTTKERLVKEKIDENVVLYNKLRQQFKELSLEQDGTRTLIFPACEGFANFIVGISTNNRNEEIINFQITPNLTEGARFTTERLTLSSRGFVEGVGELGDTIDGYVLGNFTAFGDELTFFNGLINNKNEVISAIDTDPNNPIYSAIESKI